MKSAEIWYYLISNIILKLQKDYNYFVSDAERKKKKKTQRKGNDRVFKRESNYFNSSGYFSWLYFDYDFFKGGRVKSMDDICEIRISIVVAVQEKDEKEKSRKLFRDIKKICKKYETNGYSVDME